MKGTVTIGELTLPIIDIVLGRGQVVLYCDLPPGQSVRADHYDVYDLSGQLVYRCPRAFDLGPMPGRCVLTFSLRIDRQTATPGQPELKVDW